MEDKNYPPYNLTDKMLNYVSEITEKIVRINYMNLDKKPELRKHNRINSIYSSLAIENNPLSLKQVEDIIDGRIVVGKQKDIQEVKNAYKSYEEIENINPYSIEDLKKIHGIMTFLVQDDNGKFRNHGEAVYNGDKMIFMAPPENMVPILMENLFEWMNKSKEIVHPLILSSVFHYEFVFIHPFKDGNGRTARLWQNVILSNWEEIFEYVPIESQIKKYQEEYYSSIANCDHNGDSTEFIEFMLKMIDETLEDLMESTSVQASHISSYVNKLLDVMETGVAMTTSELMEKLDMKSRISFRDNYLNPALENGLIKMTNPDKPTSKNQMYYKV